MKKFTKILKNQKGLTLIELLAVIVILAIVAAIAVPAIGNIINDSKDKAILSNASSIISGAKLAYTNGDCKGGTITATGVTVDDICEGGEIKDYVEGLVLDATTDYVNVNDWVLTWAGLASSNFKSADYIPATNDEAAILNKLNQ